MENDPAPGTYTITRADDAGTAARIQSAQEANQVIREALDALEAEDPDRAKTILEAYHQTNQTLIQSATP